MKNAITANSQGADTQPKKVTDVVSKKFYDYIAGRVSRALGFVAGGRARPEWAMEYVDRYILTGEEPKYPLLRDRRFQDGAHNFVEMIFRLLKVEIDQAVGRSRAARERARRRKEKPHAEEKPRAEDFCGEEKPHTEGAEAQREEGIQAEAEGLGALGALRFLESLETLESLRSLRSLKSLKSLEPSGNSAAPRRRGAAVRCPGL